MRVKMRVKIAKFSSGDTDLQTSQMYLEETALVHLHLALLRLFWINNYIFIIIDQWISFYFWDRPWYSDECARRLHYIPCLGAIQKVRMLSRGGGGVPKKHAKAYRGRGEVMQECMYAHNLANTRSFYFVLLFLFP